MFRIEIEPVWRFRREHDAQAMLVMLDFLNEIRATGKITQRRGPEPACPTAIAGISSRSGRGSSARPWSSVSRAAAPG